MISFVVSLFVSLLLLALAWFAFVRVSRVLGVLIGLAFVCVVVAFLAPLRHQVGLTFPAPLEGFLLYLEGLSRSGARLLAGVLRYLGRVFGVA